MSLASRFGSLIALAVALASPRAWAVGSERLPLAARARPLTLPTGSIALDGALALHREATASGLLTTTLSLGASWSPTDDVELSVTALPLALTPRIAFGIATPGGFARDASAGVRWRLARGAVQAGFGLRTTFRAGDSATFGVDATVPVQITFGRARLDLSVSARVELHDAVDNELSARAALLVQLTPPLALALTTSATLFDLGLDARVAVGLTGSYAIAGPGNAPRVDVALSIDFDRFYDAIANDLRLDVYTVVGATRFYLR